MPIRPALLDHLRLRPAQLDREQRWLLVLAGLYASSGLLHVLVWWLDPSPWAGDVSWRKPIVFGLSGAITTASLAWALGGVPASRGRTSGAWIYGVAMTLEIGLITMQRWRGVASHFNTATPFDTAVFNAMGALIMVASLPVVSWTRAAWRNPALDPARRVAIVGGLVLLDVGLLVGVSIAGLGSAMRALGDAGGIATARALVPAHALGLHGPQLTAALAWWWAGRAPASTATALWRVVGSTLLVIAALVGLAFGSLAVTLAAVTVVAAAVAATARRLPRVRTGDVGQVLP